MYRKAKSQRLESVWSVSVADRSIQHDATIIVNGDGSLVLLSNLAALGNLFGVGLSSIQISICSSTLGG